MDPGKIALEQMMLSKRRIAHTNNNNNSGSTWHCNRSGSGSSVNACHTNCQSMPRPLLPDPTAWRPKRLALSALLHSAVLLPITMRAASALFPGASCNTWNGAPAARRRHRPWAPSLLGTPDPCSHVSAPPRPSRFVDGPDAKEGEANGSERTKSNQ